jgi:microcin C transport system substrate-binding protein
VLGTPFSVRYFIYILFLTTLNLSTAYALPPEASKEVHGISLFGTPKYGPEAKHFDYVNPDAPKGGSLVLSVPGTIGGTPHYSFDNLNPYTVKGLLAAGVYLTGATLLTKSYDEQYTLYGYIAESVQLSSDNKWVAFKLRKNATFHDGTPITPEDVIFTVELLKRNHAPGFRTALKKVQAVEKSGSHTVKFTFFEEEDKEFAFRIGTHLIILSKKDYETRNIEKTTLLPPLGAGPYKIIKLDPGLSITYERIKNWWGQEVPALKGLYNFNKIRYDYFRSPTMDFHAFKAGKVDCRHENRANFWATEYNFSAVKNGDVLLLEIPNVMPPGIVACSYNTRREPFKNLKVRRALGYLLDFQWMNKNFFYNSYKRTNSYFNGTSFASSGAPSGKELKILNKFKDLLPEKLFTSPFVLPQTDGSGNIRENVRIALRILKEAGWILKNNKLIQEKTGIRMTIEILYDGQAFEKVGLSFVRNLKQIGIDVKLRTADSAQINERIKNFDFDILLNSGFSLHGIPGRERSNMFGSKSADIPGSHNYAGIKDPVVDKLIDNLVNTTEYDELLAVARALDRVLLWKHYVIPLWYIDNARLAC